MGSRVLVSPTQACQEQPTFGPDCWDAAASGALGEFPTPCSDPGNPTYSADPCPADEATRTQWMPQFVVRTVVRDSVGHTEQGNGLVVSMGFEETALVKFGTSTPLVMVGPGGSVGIRKVMHWMWGGKTAYFYPADGVTPADFNAVFAIGDTVGFLKADGIAQLTVSLFGGALRCVFLCKSSVDLDPCAWHWWQPSVPVPGHQTGQTPTAYCLALVPADLCQRHLHWLTASPASMLFWRADVNQAHR